MEYNKIKEKTMVHKLFLLKMLVILLTFGMMILSCDDNSINEVDTNPSPPTGLTGTVISPNNSIQLTWNSVSNAETYIIGYKKNTATSFQTQYGITTTSYTFSNLDFATKYDFRIAVIKDGFRSDNSPSITVETGNPLTANVSISMETRYIIIPGSINRNYYSVLVELTLSNGAQWNANGITENLFRSWVTMSGTPNVGTWSVTTFDYSRNPQPQTVQFAYTFNSTTNNVSISGLTATIVTSRLTEMMGYTNVVNSLTIGTPSSASSSTWLTN